MDLSAHTGPIGLLAPSLISEKENRVSAIPPDAASNLLGEPCPHLTLVRVLGRNVLKESLDSVDYERRGLAQDYSLCGDFRRSYLSS